MLNIYDQQGWCVGRAEHAAMWAGEQKASWAKMEAQQTGAVAKVGVGRRVWPLLDFAFSRVKTLLVGGGNVFISFRSKLCYLSSRRHGLSHLLKTILWLKPLRTTWWFTRLRFSRCDWFIFFFEFTLVQTLRLGYWTICACVLGEHLADCSYGTTGRYNKDRWHQGKR